MSRSKRLSVFSRLRMAASRKSKSLRTDNRSSSLAFIPIPSATTVGTAGNPGPHRASSCLTCVKPTFARSSNQASQVLTEDFGFTERSGSKQKATDGAAGSAEHHRRADWGELFARLFAGERLHDSIVELAASFTAIGMSEAAAIERLRSLMDASNAPKDERWRERYDDIPRALRSAKEKFGKPSPSLVPELGPDGRLIRSSAEFVADFVPPD